MSNTLSARRLKFRKDRFILWLFLILIGLGGIAVKSALADPSIYDTVDTGRKTVSSAGTRVQLTTSPTAVTRVVLEALRTNSGIVVVGGSNVVAAQGTRQGISLASGDTVTMHVNDLSDIYVDAVTNDDGVSYMWYR